MDRRISHGKSRPDWNDPWDYLFLNCHTFSISGTVLVQYTSFPTSGWASWYEVMRDSNVMVLPVPVGICMRRRTGAIPAAMGIWGYTSIPSW